jgi:hypothetical protein
MTQLTWLYVPSDGVRQTSHLRVLMHLILKKNRTNFTRYTFSLQPHIHHGNNMHREARPKLGGSSDFESTRLGYCHMGASRFALG